MNPNLMSWLQRLTIIGGAIAILYGGGQWMYKMSSLVATRDYHNQDLEVRLEQQLAPIKQSVIASEVNTLPARIKNILNIQCAANGQLPADVQRILNRLLARYKELEQRDYNIGTCVDGKHYSVYEAQRLLNE